MCSQFYVRATDVRYFSEFSKNGREIRWFVLIIYFRHSPTHTRTRTTQVTRKNLRLRLGDIVTVHEAPDVKYATVVHVLPYAEDLEGVTGETFETFLQPFFEGEFKPVSYLTSPAFTAVNVDVPAV